MSAPKSRLNPAGARSSAPLYVPATLVDTNALLQAAIRQLSPAARADIVLRCDELARLKASAAPLENAFAQLLQMIVAEREPESKLFLHITCAKDKTVETSRDGISRFLIQFHTNLSLHATWMQETEANINHIASLLLPYGGKLTVNQLKNTGCVFIISLPGK
jgi:hypothetical protein